MDVHTFEAGLSDQEARGYCEAYLQLKSRYWRVMLPLFIAYAGQATLLASFIEERVNRHISPLAFVIAGIPWLVYFTVTFVRVPPPILPQTFRRVLLLVATWYATTSILLVIAGVAQLIPMGSLPAVVATLVWACALSGWLGVPTLLRCSRTLACQEPKS